MITVHLAGLGCRRFEGMAAAECAKEWVRQAREMAEEDPWLAETPDGMSILAALSSTPGMTGIQVAQAISRPKRTIRLQILTLSRRGHVRMTGRGGRGGGKRWEVTAAGQDELEDSEEPLPRPNGD